METFQWVIVGIIVLAVLAVVIYWRTRTSSSYTSRSTEDQEALFILLIQRVAPVVRGRRFEKREVDEMLSNNPLYDQVMHYHFTTLLTRGELTPDNLRFAITGRRNRYD
jgi:hypothetical protein